MRSVAKVLFIVLMATTISQATEWSWIGDLDLADFNSSGIGARSKAMGGTYMALDNAAFASFENPATMIKTNKSLMSINLTNYQDSKEFPYGYYIRSHTNLDSNTTLTTKLKKETYRFDQVAAVAPFTYWGRDWWIGGGYHTVTDFSFKFEGVIPAEMNSQSDFLFNQNLIYESGKTLDVVNMALATNIMQYLSAGVNFNYYTRRYEGDYSDGYYNENDIFIGYNHHFKSNFTGINTDIGLFGHLDRYSAGMVIRTPYILRINALNSTPIFYGIPGADGFGPIRRVKVKYHFPISYAFGVSANPIDQLTLAADVDLKPYSDTKISIHYEDDLTEGVEKANANWNDMTQIRIGAEYVLNAGFAQIPLRAGYHNLPIAQYISKIVQDTVWEDTAYTTRETYTYSDANKPGIISFGTGLKFERIWFDMAYEFGSADYDYTIDYSWYETPFSASFPQKYKYSRLYFSIGMLF